MVTIHVFWHYKGYDLHHLYQSKNVKIVYDNKYIKICGDDFPLGIFYLKDEVQRLEVECLV